MTTINLTPEPLTAENFNQFGDVLSIENKDSITINDGFANKFADLAKIDTQEEGAEDPIIENIRVFISNGDQGISYSRGVWHFPLISLKDNAQFVVIDRKHNIDQDTIKQCTVRKIEDVDINVGLSL